jgi:hypothetical protein
LHYKEKEKKQKKKFISSIYDEIRQTLWYDLVKSSCDNRLPKTMRKKPFKIKLTILIYVLCFISIGLYSIIQFRYTERVFLNKFEQEKFMVEEQVLLAVKDADVNYSMLELQFDEQIRNALYDMHFRYMRDGSLKLPDQAIVPGVNYYVIDENNSVIMTTDPIDEGLSFQGIPEFKHIFGTQRVKTHRNYNKSRTSGQRGKLFC